MPFDHHLGDAISNRRDPQRAHPAIALRYVDPPHRWRKVAARRQTIPKFIEVVFKISLEIRNHLAVYASRPLVGSDPLIGFPHLPFRNVIRLGSIHEGPPVASCPLARAEQRFWVVVWLMGRIGCLLAMPLTTTAPYPSRADRRGPMESLSNNSLARRRSARAGRIM